MKEEKYLRQAACYAFAVMIITICISFALQQRDLMLLQEQTESSEQEQIHTVMLPEPTMALPANAVVQGGHAEFEEVWEVWQFLSADTLEIMDELIGSRCILVKKPEGEALVWKLEENLPAYSMKFSVSGADQRLHAASVLRIWDDTYCYGMPGEEEILKDISVLSYEDGEHVTSEISFVFDLCYVPEVIEKEEYYIINLRKYKEVYDRIVVLDAGHGGHDPGAGAERYRYSESNITLKLLLYLKELLEENTDITVICTRTEDVYRTLEERANLALGVEADFFVSWHCNASESSARRGTQVIYNAKQGTEDTYNSKVFAGECLQALCSVLGTRKEGIFDRQDLHIVRRATMPVVLIETAYMSNASDMNILKYDENLQKAANAVYEVILSAYGQREETVE